ncbi:SET domain-containing protein [bacterium]
MIHPSTELKFISPEIGYGVVATENIPKGTITWVLDKLDREFSPEEFAQMEPLYKDILEKYSYRNGVGNYILCWDIGRYMNHSFRSNCMTTAYNFEIAICDIQQGEQLTDDYGYFNISEPFRGIDEGTRRKIVYPDDLLRYHKVWDKKVQSVLKYISEAKQPLRPIIEDEIWDMIQSIVKGMKELDSVLGCYYSVCDSNSYS